MKRITSTELRTLIGMNYNHIPDEYKNEWPGMSITSYYYGLDSGLMELTTARDGELITCCFRCGLNCACVYHTDDYPEFTEKSILYGDLSDDWLKELDEDGLIIIDDDVSSWRIVRFAGKTLYLRNQPELTYLSDKSNPQYVYQALAERIDSPRPEYYYVNWEILPETWELWHNGESEEGYACDWDNPAFLRPVLQAD